MKNSIIRLIFLTCSMHSMNNIFGQGTRLNASVAAGISTCVEIGCEEDDPDFIGDNLNCLNCHYHEAEKVMQEILSKKKRQYAEKNMNFDAIMNQQKKWEKEVEKLAQKESDQYKGGRMEMTEYVRTKLKLTKSRNAYLKTI